MSTATEIASIKKIIEEMNARFEIIEQRITKVELAQNDFIKKTKEIKKGIATKVAFDSSGLITNSLSLEAKDIPEISIDKIKNLTDSLETLDRLITENKNTISLLQKSVQILETAKPVEQKTTLNDIPELPISKISGLKEKLELIEKPRMHSDLPKEKQKILESDIPAIIKNRITNLEETMLTKGTIDSVDKLRKEINLLKESINQVEEQIKNKEKSTIKTSEIPELPISKINNLKIELSKKADHSEVSSFHSLIDLANRSTATQFKHLREELNFKIDYATFSIIENRILHLEELIGNLLNQYPIDKIMDEINILKEKL